MKDDKKSILKEALTDYNEIMEAADANAKKKLAEEFPEKFNNLLKEEIKNKKKSVEESYKKLDESKESEKDEAEESNKESVMKKQEKEAKKVEETAGKDGVFTEKPKKEVDTVEEDVKIIDTRDGNEPFTEKSKKQPAKKIEETAGKDGVFTENPKKSLQTEEFDITELDMQGVGSAVENAEGDDQFLTMEEIEREISEMEGLGEELEGIESSSPSYMEDDNKGVAFNQLVEMRKQLDEIIDSMGGETGEVNELFGGLGKMFGDPKKEIQSALNSINPQNLDASSKQLSDLVRKAYSEYFASTYGGASNKMVDKITPQNKYTLLQDYLSKGKGAAKISKNPTTGQPELVYVPFSGLKTASATAPVVTGAGGMNAPMEEMHSPGNETFGSTSQINRLHNQGPTNQLIDELDVNEMHAAGNETFGSTSQINRLHNQGPTSQLIDEEPSDDDINAMLGEPSEVDEAMGISHTAGTITPGKLGDHEGTHGRFRQLQAESKKKINGLINENKNLTKKINEVNKYKESVSSLLEQYKTALEKYRNQLKEMAVFNTNLAHVNNLLVNEELALTQEDKIKIINEFKKVDTIAESQKKYKTFIVEMKENRKTLSESVEEKVTTSIQPSSKQKLDEVVEKTAYADDKHIQKMKKLIEYVENRGKKIIK